MNNKELLKFLERGYFKEDNQTLKLKRLYEENDNECHYDQLICYKDRRILEISTLDNYKFSDKLGSIPYCMRGDWSDFKITIQKFGRLNKYEEWKAIVYFLYIIGNFFIFNITLDEESVNIERINIYSLDNESIREWDEIRRKANERKC